MSAGASGARQAREHGPPPARGLGVCAPSCAEIAPRSAVMTASWMRLLLAACVLSSGHALRVVPMPVRAASTTRAARAPTIALDASIVEAAAGGIEAAGGALADASASSRLRSRNCAHSETHKVAHEVSSV